jgi:hypothetical protein
MGWMDGFDAAVVITRCWLRVDLGAFVRLSVSS